MSSPDRVLETLNDQAAVSRFFYSLAPVDTSTCTGPGLYAYSREFAERYATDLKHPLSLIAAKAIDATGDQRDLHKLYKKEDMFDHRFTAMVAFDQTHAACGIYGWQINLTRLAESPDSLSHGRVVFGLYASAQAEHTRVKRFDMQGREVESAARQSCDPAVTAAIARTLLKPLLDPEAIAAESARMEKDRGELAQKILEFLRTHTDSVRNLKEQDTMETQLDNIAFGQISFRFGTPGFSGQLVRTDD